MRRADRLFQIIQLLRVRGTVTAANLADELEVSERTIYRDIQDLMASGVPIEGEAGVGYALPREFDLPPLMFTDQEIEALVVGARMVEAWGDQALAQQARNVLVKAESVLPEQLRERLRSVDIYVPDYHISQSLTENMAPLRKAISRRRKIRFGYTNLESVTTERTVRPLGLYFWGTAWTVVGWCELRQSFRNFRPDRMRDLQVTDDPIPEEKGRDLETFLQRIIAGMERGDDNC